MAYYSRPEEVLVELLNRFRANQEFLGLAYIATQEEQLIPNYPCVQIAAGQVLREIHGTQTFELTVIMELFVYHANLRVGYSERTLEDMELATNVVHFLHRPANRRLVDDVTGEDKLVFGYVAVEDPGTVYRESSPGIITTRLMWQGLTQVRFDES